MTRQVTLQVQQGGHWTTARTGKTTKKAAYSFWVTAPASIGSYGYRVRAPKTTIEVNQGGEIKIKKVPALRTPAATLNVAAATQPPPPSQPVPADTTPPPVPAGPTPTAGDGQIALSWPAIAGANDLAGFHVYRATSPGGPWTKLTSTPLASINYTATGLTNGTVYYLAVTSIDTTGNESALSPSASATPFAGPPKLTAVAPHTVLAAGGDVVTLTGTGLSQVDAIVIGDERITDHTQPNATTIQFSAPAVYPGTYPISLETSGDGEVATDHSLTFAVPETEPVFETTVAEGTWTLAPADLVDIERLTDTGNLVLIVAAGPGVDPGTAVYVTPGGSLLPTGLTARVVSSSSDDVPGRTRVTVEPTAADEVLENFEITGSGPLAFDEQAPLAQLSYREDSGAVLKANGRSVARSPAGLAGGKSLFTCKDAFGEPNQNIVTSLNVDLRFENTRYQLEARPKGFFQDEYVNAGIWSEPVLSVTGTVKGEVTCELSVWARDQAFPAIPVPGLPGVMIDIGPFFEVSISAGGTFGYEQRFYRGFSYIKNGDAQGVARPSGSEDDPVITGSLNASVRVSAGGFFELSLFDRVGVSAEIGPYLEGQIAYSPSPPSVTCSLELGVSMSAKFFLDVLVSRWEYEFASLTLPIHTWEACSVPDEGGGTPTTSLWTSVVSDSYTSCGVRQDGTGLCWGSNSRGKRGDGSGEAIWPTPKLLPGTWRSFSTGEYTTCGVRTDNTGWCWGANDHGEIGDGTNIQRYTPVQVPGSWSSITTSTPTTCGIQTDGSGWCWGLNDKGQVGDGTTTDRSTPVRLPGGGWRSLTRGTAHYATTTCGVREDGTGWCWGGNFAGQVGDGTTIDRLVPTQLPGDNWTTLATNERGAPNLGVTCGLRSDHTAWCWGSNADGQVGDGTTTNRLTPTKLSGSNWSSVRVSAYTVCGTQVDGSGYCWGMNNSGQIGDGTTSSRLAPTLLPGSNWTSLNVSLVSTCGVQADGSGWCWGSNYEGQVGDGTTTDRPTPTQLPGTDWISISSGGNGFTRCGLRSDGSAWCWGGNSSGQHGSGTFENRYVPVRVVDPVP